MTNQVAKTWALRPLSVIVLLAFTPLSSYASPVHHTLATYYVRGTGDDNADGKTPSTALRSISKALTFAHGSGKVVIGPGDYRECISFSCPPAASADSVERGVAHDSTLILSGDESGKLTAAKAGPVIVLASDENKPAMSIHGVNRLEISGITFKGPGAGLEIADCADGLIDRCTFDGAVKGVALANDIGSTVRSSVFSHCAIGMSVSGSVQTKISHITFAACRSLALLLLASRTGTVTDSLFADNSTNLLVDVPSSLTWTSDYNVFAGRPGTWGPTPAISNPYQWWGASKQERHSVYVAPCFVSSGTSNFHISPIVGWGGGLPGQFVGIPSGAVDRDGVPFVVLDGSASCGAYQYPEPTAENGWKQLDVSVPEGVRQSAGIYVSSGVKDNPILVRTLLADATGVHRLWWDGRDDFGQPAKSGSYQVVVDAHDIRLLDDGAIGNNGTPEGQYANFFAERILALDDGGFLVTQSASESGFTVRRYDSSGQSIYASAQPDSNFWGLAHHGDSVIAGLDSGFDAKLVTLVLPGERAQMPNGTMDYHFLAPYEKSAKPVGVAVIDDKAFVTLAGLNVVRLVDLKTGAKIADWPVVNVGDISASPDGKLYVVSGTNIVELDNDGRFLRTMATGLAEVDDLTAGPGKLAAVDTAHSKISIVSSTTGGARIIGIDRTATYQAVAGDLFLGPRGPAFLKDGRLAIPEYTRIRLLDVDATTNYVDIMSDYVDSGVANPIDPTIVYTNRGIFKVDYTKNTWKLIVELDPSAVANDKYPAHGFLLSGKPFLAMSSGNKDTLVYDLSEPLSPKLCANVPVGVGIYNTIAISRSGDIITSGRTKLTTRHWTYKGFDTNQCPEWDTTKPTVVGPDTDPNLARGMTNAWGMACDRSTDNLYFIGLENHHNTLVPGWGANGKIVGKQLPDGTPAWSALSSGADYMAIDAINDGHASWIFGCQSFGAQADVFDPYGLRLTTGNWDSATGYGAGFVDLRAGFNAFIRPDGKVGAYVEDDGVGRLCRWRLDGANTLRRQVSSLNWFAVAANLDAPLPNAEIVEGATPPVTQVIPRIASPAINGDWSQWGIDPQIVILPGNITFKRTAPGNLLQTFGQATAIAGLAHDGANLYAYFLVADDNPHFDATTPHELYQTDGIEFWLEQDQFGLGMLKDGSAQLFKYRFHDATGKPWAKQYSLPKEDVWAHVITDMSAHPLGRRLELVTGRSVAGMSGYAVEAKIPFNEIWLVGGIAGRDGGAILPLTDKPGEVVRVGVSLDKVNMIDRIQDYMTNWPISLMFSDPSQSQPFALGK